MGGIWAAVKENREVGQDVHRLRLDAPGVAAAARPGQFVMLRVAHGNDPLLARPFSIHGVAGGDLLILYKVVGRGTRILSQIKPGQKTLFLWGPLGAGFDLNVERPVLVAGGMGRASLEYVRTELLKTQHFVPYINAENELGQINQVIKYMKETSKNINIISNINDLSKMPTKVTTDEILKEAEKQMGWTTGTTVSLPASVAGGLGGKGLAADYLDEILSAYPWIARSVLTCGPMPMLKAVARVSRKHQLPCQVSLEAPMACGLGACLGCAVPAATGGYLRACQEGPVLDAGRVDWERV